MPLEELRASCSDGRWGDAHRLLDVLDVDALAPMDLDCSATAAYLTGHDPDAFALWGKAHEAAVRDSDLGLAIHFAIRIAGAHLFKGDIPRGRGWVDRTSRLLARAEVVIAGAHDGHLEHCLAMCDLFEHGDVPGAHARFVAAGKIADRFDDEEMATMARIGEGRMLIYLGEVAAGVGLLDEAMVAVESGSVSAIAAGDAYCTVIDAMHELFDFDRCQTWTDSFARWCDGQQDLVLYRGHCFVHRAELLLFHGKWDQALREARAAVERLADPPMPGILGAGHYLEGEVYRLRGALDAADAAYRRANAHQFMPQPGFALLRLAQGHVDSAHALIHRVTQESAGPVNRARMLGACAEISVAAGDLTTAQEMADELRAIALELSSRVLEATAADARARIALASDQSGRALAEARMALDLWRRLDAPYEVARSRLVIAAACRAVGDGDGAEIEQSTAEAALTALGAGATTIQDPATDLLPDGLTQRELDVIRVLAEGKTNRAIARELFISEKTVASHVSHIYTKIGVTSRAGATAYAFERGLVGGHT